MSGVNALVDDDDDDDDDLSSWPYRPVLAQDVVRANHQHRNLRRKVIRPLGKEPVHVILNIDHSVAGVALH